MGWITPDTSCPTLMPSYERHANSPLTGE